MKLSIKYERGYGDEAALPLTALATPEWIFPRDTISSDIYYVTIPYSSTAETITTIYITKTDPDKDKDFLSGDVFNYNHAVLMSTVY